jgi:hypothetical protein
MARSLRKHKLDGTPYSRRDKVEFEIQASLKSVLPNWSGEPTCGR